MTKAKLYTLEFIRAFMTYAYDRYTDKQYQYIGGCETCGYGASAVTIGVVTDMDALYANMEDDIDEFSKTFKQDIGE